MGSMTGAPKISAMKIIEELEETKRGLYSGAVGYFTPDGDFDFNVVIRSILYSSKNKYVSFSVGGAITSKSIPELEYEECLLKAKAMRDALMKNSEFWILEKISIENLVSSIEWKNAEKRIVRFCIGYGVTFNSECYTVNGKRKFHKLKRNTQIWNL